MKDSIERYLVIIVYIVLVTALIFCALENILNPWKTVYVSLAIIALFTLKQIFYELKDLNNSISYVLISAEIVMTAYLSVDTSGTSFRIFYFVIMYEVIFSMKKGRAAFICSMLYALDVAADYIKLGQAGTAAILKYELYNFPLYLLIAVVLFLAKYIIDMNNSLFTTQNRLTAANMELENAYKNLKEAYRKNEDYLVIEGKNKLAREIHDTVGHTLTTALVEMEASKILMSSDTNKSLRKLEAATNQVRKGLNEVRHSVSALNSNDADYHIEMINLITDLKKHTDVSIRYDIDDINEEKEELKKCMFRALQEGITNSIRHGNATAIVFKLKYIKDYLFFSLEDNGNGCSFYKKGFGLSAMEERVREVCGSMEIMTEPGEGFNIYIKFCDLKRSNDDKDNNN